MLTQFAFRLTADWEVPAATTKPPPKPFLKDNVKDMLVKHHLFSWDI